MRLIPGCLSIQASPEPAFAACPACAQPSQRLHSRYQRKLYDLPWQGRPVALQVRARRFRCLNPLCPRQTFAERLPGVAAAGARRTERLGALQSCLGLALGGEAGHRLAERLAMSASADTLLRLACKAGNGNAPPHSPQVIAVDDWAWRRGHRYGTIVVDLERNAVVDLLPDRQADTLAAWLRENPGVKIVVRDRAGAYADGVRQGAPGAVQVTDRWHLLRNLGDAVRTVIDPHHAAIRRIAKQVNEQSIAVSAPAAIAKTDSPNPSAATRRSQASHARRQARYEDAARLHATGASISRIAAQLGAERKTIQRWLRAGGVPRRRKPPRNGVLAPYQSHLERRWTEGRRNAARLWRELVRLGFKGRPGTVRAWAGRRRKDEPRAATGNAAVQPSSVRRVAPMLTADADALSQGEQAFVSHLLAQIPELAAALAVAKRLSLLLRHKSQESLTTVLADADKTQLSPFADSIRRDLDAVQAALDLPWTTSPAEGQINKLKMLKRTRYGRAGFPLLRARVLNAA